MCRWTRLAEKEAKDGPLVEPGLISLEAGNKEPLPLLDDFYSMAAQQRKRESRPGCNASTSPPLVESDFSPYLLVASASLPFLQLIVESDWNPVLRPALCFRHWAAFTASEDALLTLAFSRHGAFYSPPTRAVSPDWALVQARYLPARSVQEVRKRFSNIRLRQKDHPLHAIKLKIGTRGYEASLTPREIRLVEEGLQMGKRKPWAAVVEQHFPSWDRRALKRSATWHRAWRVHTHCLALALSSDLCCSAVCAG